MRSTNEHLSFDSAINREALRQFDESPSTTVSILGSEDEQDEQSLWEEDKSCKDAESNWQDSAYKHVAIAMCRNQCTVIQQCIDNDRRLGGARGIKFGMDQTKRQDYYARGISSEEIAQSIYVVRALNK